MKYGRGLLIAFVWVVVWIGFPSAYAHEAHTVKIENISFIPATLDINIGDTVIWTNSDLVPHTVTAKDKSFDSGTIDPGKTWKHRFKNKTKVDYICRFHPNMAATVDAK